MSLMLRKACQETLDKYGLSMYHTEIGDSGYRGARKHLKIIGECGKELVTITGITFTRNEPKNAEIEYAVELFNDFMNMHGKLIQNYITRAKALMNAKKLATDFGDYSVSKEMDDKWVDGKRVNFLKHYRVSITDGTFRFIYSVSPDMKKIAHIDTEFAVHNARQKSAKNIAAWKDTRITGKMKKAKEFVRLYYNRASEEKAVEELLQKVTACNV